MCNSATVPEVLHKALHAGETRLSIEVIPPFKGENIQTLFQSIDTLIEAEPDFINVTHHPEERILSSHEGHLVEKVISKRPGTVGICAALMQRYPRTSPVAHVICTSEGKDRIEDNLIDLNYLGIRNILALRGDKPKRSSQLKAPKNAPILSQPVLTSVRTRYETSLKHTYASDLIKQIVKLNQGTYLDSSLKQNTPTKFSIGVAGYPEKHPESIDLDADVYYLKQKVELGCEYIVTQMFFDNRYFFDFVKRCRAAGITVPIVPGLKPLATRKHCEILPQIFNITFPDTLLSAVQSASSPEAVRQIGIEWCIQQCQELKKAGVPMLHFYTMNRSENIKAIIKAIF